MIHDSFYRLLLIWAIKNNSTLATATKLNGLHLRSLMHDYFFTQFVFKRKKKKEPLQESPSKRLFHAWLGKKEKAIVL